MSEFTHLGKGRKIIDGLEKILGQTQYVSDLEFAGMLHIKLVLSVYAHAKIKAVHLEDAKALDGVVAVLTADDLPTRGKVINSRSSAVLAKDVVLFAGQPVVAVVARTAELASDAAALVDIEYEELPTVPNMVVARADEIIVWKSGVPKEGADLTALHGDTAVGASVEVTGSNILESKTFSRGDVTAAFASADIILEQTFSTPWVHQAYLEPHAAIVVPGVELTVYSSTQGQFAVRAEVARLLGIPDRKVRVVPMTVGGGFGAKYGLIEPLVAAIAVALNKPVKMVLTRSEDMMTTTPAPATQFKARLAANSNGDLLALEADVDMDNGVFPFGFGGIVAMLFGGTYKCPNYRSTIRQLATHKPQGGAYRAPGAPQVAFVLESLIDQLVRRVNADPISWRLRHAVEAGDLTGTGATWGVIGMRDVLLEAQKHPLLSVPREPNVGVGIAVGAWGGAFSPAGAVCRVEPDGTVRLQVGSVDISGVHSSLVLVVAETLSIEPEQVELVQGDTNMGPYAPASGGSQVTVSVSGAVLDASSSVKQQLLKLAATELEAHIEDLELKHGQAQVKGVPERGITIAKLAGIAQRKAGGDGPIVAEGRSAMKSGAPGFAVHIAKVHVDPDTGFVTPLAQVAIQDVGFALNPTLVQGQMHGGTAQGIGMGLYEAMRHDEVGGHATANFLEYAFPRAMDIPPLETIMVENPSDSAPFGARVVGEPPLVPGAAALTNAIFDACGVRILELPAKPETIWREMRALKS
jgi:CO/xanthine dehydrogenase Mo-binding subunit